MISAIVRLAILGVVYTREIDFNVMPCRGDIIRIGNGSKFQKIVHKIVDISHCIGVVQQISVEIDCITPLIGPAEVVRTYYKLLEMQGWKRE